jgi:integral membrane protein
MVWLAAEPHDHDMTPSALARLHDLNHLRLAALCEGLTLLTLLAVAVPLKHLAGQPLAVSIAGPVHGLAFLVYLWLTINIAAGADWSARDVGRLLGAAFVPFGFISTLRFIRRRRAESAS